MAISFNPRIYLTIINQSKLALKRQILREQIKKIIVTVGKNYLPNTIKSLNLRLALMTKKEIGELKKRYKSLKDSDEIPDVLSFPEEEIASDEISEKSNQKKLGSGDIAICPEIIKENSKRDQLSFPYALLETILHGFWHLCGLKHDYKSSTLKKIHQRQKELITEAKCSENFLKENFNI